MYMYIYITKSPLHHRRQSAVDPGSPGEPPYTSG